MRKLPLLEHNLLSILSDIFCLTFRFQTDCTHLTPPPETESVSALSVCMPRASWHVTSITAVPITRLWLYSLCCTRNPCSLFLVVHLNPLPLFCHSLFPPPTGNHFIFHICKSGFLLYSLVCFIFKIPQVSNVIQYLSFSVWPISLSLVLKHVHVAANGKISFLFFFFCAYLLQIFGLQLLGGLYTVTSIYMWLF